MKFAVTLEQDGDGIVVASCPALPGCHSQGRTTDEAIVNVKAAFSGTVPWRPILPRFFTSFRMTWSN